MNREIIMIFIIHLTKRYSSHTSQILHEEKAIALLKAKDRSILQTKAARDLMTNNLAERLQSLALKNLARLQTHHPEAEAVERSEERQLLPL